jgi:hypothetical protein
MAVQNWYNWTLWERKSDRKHKYVQTWNILNQLSCIVYYSKGPSWSCSYGSWIYNYLWNQCLSPLMLWVRISIRARCTTICDKVYQWLATGRWFSLGPLVSSTNKTDHHDITEILLKVALNTIKQTFTIQCIEQYLSIDLPPFQCNLLWMCHLHECNNVSCNINTHFSFDVFMQ